MKGRTRPGRLAAVEHWLALAGPPLPPGSCVIDIGFGDEPLTSVEWSHALGPSVTVFGVEHDAARLAGAHAFAHATLRFVADVDLSTLPRAHVIRAMNVLRGYSADDAVALRDAWSAQLAEGGVLLEGSTDTEGHVTVAQVLRRTGDRMVREALLFHTDFSRGFSPWLFRDWLPRDFRRACHPGTPVHAFLAEWSARCDALPAGQSPRSRFEASLGCGTEVERVGDVVVWRPPTEIRDPGAPIVRSASLSKAPVAQNHSLFTLAQATHRSGGPAA